MLGDVDLIVLMISAEGPKLEPTELPLWEWHPFTERNGKPVEAGFPVLRGTVRFRLIYYSPNSGIPHSRDIVGDEY